MNQRSSLIDQLRIDPVEETDTHRVRWIVLAIVLVTIIASAIGMWLWKRGAAVTVTAASPQRVEQGTATRAQSVLDASGYVIARRMATVSSQATGKLAEVNIEEGMAVREGQVLARLDQASEQAQLALSQAQLAAARAALGEIRVQLDDARRTRDRQDSLRERGLTSSAELDAAQAQVGTLEARLAARQKDIAVAERQVALRRELLDQTVIRAPFAGMVVAKAAQPGEMVSPVSAGGGFTRTGIGTIVDMDSLEIEVDVNESYIDRVREGQAVSALLDAYPDQALPARVIAIVPTADRQKATVKVRVGFVEKDSRILPEMGVKVRFLEDPVADTVADQSPVSLLAVPASAVVREQGRNYLYIIDGDRLQRRAVSVHSRRGDRALIGSGLDRNEKVVAAPPSELTVDSRIRIEEGSPP